VAKAEGFSCQGGFAQALLHLFSISGRSPSFRCLVSRRAVWVLAI
jgi:hypothetical protein